MFREWGFDTGADAAMTGVDRNSLPSPVEGHHAAARVRAGGNRGDEARPVRALGGLWEAPSRSDRHVVRSLAIR